MFTSLKLTTVLFTVLLAAVAWFDVARAEQHVVHFDNRCGHGTPTLIRGPDVLSTGADYVSNGPIMGAIAYLQTGNCGFNGDGCTVIEPTLRNPPSPGAGSSVDITLIAPLAFSVPVGFGYFNGCENSGASCDNANCPHAFRTPTDNWVQVQCEANDVSLAITFC